MDFRHRVLACATTWRRPTPPAPSPIVDYYVSPGGAGDYAEATTSVAARGVFPAAGPAAAFTVMLWVKRAESATFDEFLLEVSTGIPNEALFAYLSDPGNDNYIQSFFAGGTSGAAMVATSYPGLSSWVHVAYVYDGSTFSVVIDGVEVGTDTQAITLAAAGSAFCLLSGGSGGSPLDASIRNIHAFTRAFSGHEIAALYAAGPTHNVRASSGAWAGETALVSWDTAAVGGVVPNTGSGGACGLSLEGAVTSEVDP